MCIYIHTHTYIHTVCSLYNATTHTHTDTPIHRKKIKKILQKCYCFCLWVWHWADFISFFPSKYYTCSAHYFPWGYPYKAKKSSDTNTISFN